MTEYGTIKIPREAYEQHNKRREELGITWLEYIDGQAPDSEEVDLTPILNRLDDMETELKRHQERVIK